MTCVGYRARKLGQLELVTEQPGRAMRPGLDRIDDAEPEEDAQQRHGRQGAAPLPQSQPQVEQRVDAVLKGDDLARRTVAAQAMRILTSAGCMTV